MFDIDDMVEEFLTEAQEHRDSIESLLLSMERCSAEEVPQIVNELFRAVHSIKGAAGTVEFENICSLTHAMETELCRVREGEIEVSASLVSALLRALDVLSTMLGDLEHQDDVDIKDVIERLSGVASVNADPKSVITFDEFEEEPEAKQETQSESAVVVESPLQEESVPDVESEESRPAASQEHKVGALASPFTDGQKKNSNETIRVPVWALDSLMALAGELVLVRNRQLQRFDERLRRDRNSVSNMDRRLTQQLDLVTSEIQDAVLRTRMQPIGIAFQKLPRLCRDLGNKLGKTIEYRSFGSETEVDKTILESLSDPLLHLVRNSCDHGLGTPSERMAAGKTPAGTICVSACQDGGQIVIRVEDDGRGIDTRRVGQKAVENGICRPEELDAMSEKQVAMLIFSPGFSTAAQVSDISGRGVGMDVVKTSIEKIGGSVDVATKPGEGTVFSMRVPLTLAIVSSLVVRCQESCFAIPQVNLEEVVCLHDEEVNSSLEFINNQPSYRLRGQLLPLVHLEDVLGHREAIPKSALVERRQQYESCPPERLTFAVVRLGTQNFGIVVDEAIGTEEIVVKPNHPMLSKVRCFVGSTVLGDGRIALILDVNGIAQHCNLDARFGEQSLEQVVSGEADEVLHQLAFTLTGEDRYLFPLSLISRVVSVRLDALDRLGDVCSVNLNGENIRVVDIAKHLGVSTNYDCDELSLILPRHINRSVGFLCNRVLNIETFSKMPCSETHLRSGVLGSMVLNNRLALLLDMFALAQAEEPTWFEGQAVPEKRVRRPARILLAEDTAFFRRVVGKYLTDLGYDVEIAEDGEIAAEMLRAHNHGIDLLISDIQMPNLDGFGLIERLRRSKDWAHCDSLPALAMSSLSAPEVQQKALDLGFDSYELKLNKDSLKNTIVKLLSPCDSQVRVA